MMPSGESPGPTGPSQSAQDLTASELQSRNARLQEALEMLGDAFLTLDRHWRFTYINPEAERLLARQREHLLGRSIWDEFKEAVGTAFDREYQRALAEGVTVRFDQFYPPLGRWLSVEAHPTREGLAVYFRDMTERRKALEKDQLQMASRYRGLLEAAPDAMLVVNPEGDIVLLNLHAKEQFGYADDELVGQPVTRIIPKGFAERLIADGERTAAEALAQQIGMGLELSGRRKDGTEFPLEIMLSPLQSDEEILITAAIRDISVRKAAEKHLAQMERRYRGLLEAAPDAMLLVNPAEAIVLVNLQTEKQFGYHRDELVARRHPFGQLGAGARLDLSLCPDAQ